MFPAYAGMDRSIVAAQSITWRVPRLRGDGPVDRLRLLSAQWCSPPTRGWTSGGPAWPSVSPVFPAYAGMDRIFRRECVLGRGVPRLRGDGPCTSFSLILLALCSPPTRGWTAVRNCAHERTGVFPAYAGMDRTPSAFFCATNGVPRLRGDGPSCRGRSSSVRAQGVFPAYAGMDRIKGMLERSMQSVLRLRGDGPVRSETSRWTPACSPPTRGWTEGFGWALDRAPVFPAYAGMDRLRGFGRSGGLRVPRLRGDGPALRSEEADPERCSPPTRGWNFLSQPLIGRSQSDRRNSEWATPRPYSKSRRKSPLNKPTPGACNSSGSWKWTPLTLSCRPIAPESIPPTKADATLHEFTRNDQDDLLWEQEENNWPNMFRQARFVPAVEYIQANRLRSLLVEDMARLMSGIDGYLAPSFSKNVRLTNLTGLPCLALPNGFDPEGRPTSISLTGRLFDESRILALVAVGTPIAQHPPRRSVRAR